MATLLHIFVVVCRKRKGLPYSIYKLLLWVGAYYPYPLNHLCWALARHFTIYTFSLSLSLSLRFCSPLNQSFAFLTSVVCTCDRVWEKCFVMQDIISFGYDDSSSISVKYLCSFIYCSGTFLSGQLGTGTFLIWAAWNRNLPSGQLVTGIFLIWAALNRNLLSGQLGTRTFLIWAAWNRNLPYLGCLESGWDCP